MITKILGLFAVSTFFVVGCGDTPTEPTFPTDNSISVAVTLSRLDPPAGIKHAVLAALVVRATQGRAVTLKSVSAGNYSGAQVVVSGFTPLRVELGKPASFSVTLTSADDIPCADGLLISVLFDNADGQQHAAGPDYSCSTGDWLF